MENHITHLVYNQKENLQNSDKIKECIESNDFILIYDSCTNTDLINQYTELSKGIITPNEVRSTQNGFILGNLYKSKKITYPLNPPTDLNTHSPYFKHKQKTISKETEIAYDFLNGDFLTSLSKVDYSINTYKYSFLYLYSFLNSILENNQDIIDQINRNITFENKKILIISSPKLLEYKFIYPNSIHNQINIESCFALSIRHEIFRRQVLNLDIPESLNYGYILESTLKNIKRINKIDYCREKDYFLRKDLTNLSFETMQEISHLLSSKIKSNEQISTIYDIVSN